ncbi:Mycothiol acetyltransferase [Arthrobacter saudimassiliensis]|uniref:Mycothiol acetyltransferase n=1 Tax=Arthrobacter saudimassiliensis TaxID=1461584 RepID=A0A078MQZ8_9MICC|nr:Mycothiol acetyltransferase [Arthrobacter saudimassiliensis]
MTAPIDPRRPGPETGLRWRALEPADVPAWHALLQRMAAVDRPPWTDTTADLEHALANSSNDPARDTLAGFDRTGTLRAFGRVALNRGSETADGFGGVDPELRGRGIGREVLRWQLERARQRLHGPGHRRPVLRVYAEEANAGHVGLLAAAGGTVSRYFTEMTRPLDAAPPEAPLPQGMSFATFSNRLSEPIRQAHNEAFRDHWGSEPRDLERWKFTTTHPHFRRDWSFAVIDGEGQVAGYHLASYDPECERIHGHTEGYTELLGVRRGWRGQGLAPAMLAEAMRRYAASQMQKAALAVDTENPSGALALYENLGYRPTHREVVFDFPLR